MSETWLLQSLSCPICRHDYFSFLAAPLNQQPITEEDADWRQLDWRVTLVNTAAAEAQSDSSEGPPSPLPSSPLNEDELELISALVRGRFARRRRGIR